MQPECVHRAKLVSRGRVGEVEIVAEVRGQPGRAGEDRQRQTGDDLAGAKRDHEKAVDQRHGRAGERRHADRERQHDTAGPADPLNRPEAHHRAHEHHAFDTEVEHARALGQQLAERRVDERRAVRDGGGQHDDDDAVVHRAVSAAG